MKTAYMYSKLVVYIRTLLRTLQAGIENTKPLIKNLSRLLRKNLGPLRVSTVLSLQMFMAFLPYALKFAEKSF